MNEIIENQLFLNLKNIAESKSKTENNAIITTHVIGLVIAYVTSHIFTISTTELICLYECC